MPDYMDLKTCLPKETIVKQLIDLKPSAIRRFDLDGFTSFTAKVKNEEITVYCNRRNGNDFASVEKDDLSEELWNSIYKDVLVYTA